MIPKRIGTVTKLDADGKVIEVQQNAFTLQEAPPGTCQECAVDHPHDQPHNQQSIFYKYRFYSIHGRWPTWSDAMAHCSEDVRKQWREDLVRIMQQKGSQIPADLQEAQTGVRR